MVTSKQPKINYTCLVYNAILTFMVNLIIYVPTDNM